MNIAGLVLVSLLSSEAQTAQEKLVRARELFQQNRWAEARVELNSELSSLPEDERSQARFLLGISYVKEAELYRSLHRFAVDVGLDYLSELAASKENAGVVWIPLFKGLYQLEAGLDEEAERSLGSAVSSKALPVEWRELARRRRAVARYRLGRRPAEKELVASDSQEARYWRVLLGLSEATGQGGSGDVFIGSDVDGLDVPDVEDDSDPQKILRFFDPVKLKALERIAWKHAVHELRPLAGSGTGFASKLGRYNAGLSLFFLGEMPEAASLLEPLQAPSYLGPGYHSRAKVLQAVAAWRSELPSESELLSLWASTQPYPETVLLWTEIELPELAIMEPFRSKLSARLEDLPSTLGERADRALVGQWALMELGSGAESAEVVRTLSSFRNHANKNKIEWNEPLLLTALSAANYRNNDYAQGLETLFELAKTFPGLRGLQWNLQGIYAARQQAAGDARITN